MHGRGGIYHHTTQTEQEAISLDTIDCWEILLVFPCINFDQYYKVYKN